MKYRSIPAQISIWLLVALFTVITVVQTAHAQEEPARTAPTPSTTPGETGPTPSKIDMLVQINVAAPFEPKEAVGLLLSSSGVSEKSAVRLDKVREGVYVVTFGYLTGEVRKDSFASAMVRSENGELAFGDIRSLNLSVKKDSFYALKACSPQKPQSVDPSRYGAFETIRSMRMERRETYRKEISDLMTGSFLDSLNKLEAGFGLARGVPLSAELPPAQLIDRLSRLLPVVHDLSERERAEPTPTP